MSAYSSGRRQQYNVDEGYGGTSSGGAEYDDYRVDTVLEDYVASGASEDGGAKPLLVYRLPLPQYQTEFRLPTDEAMNNLTDISTDAADFLIQALTSTLASPVASTNANVTNATSLPRLSPRTIGVAAYCYILPVVCVLGIIGNLMNVITLASPRLRAVSYMYLRALAIADLLCMFFVLVFASFEVLEKLFAVPVDRHPLFGFYQAHIMLAFINWSLSTGVFIVVALSLERYVSVVFPLHFRVWNSPQRAMKAIMAAYLIPALFYIPYGIGRYSIKVNVTPDGIAHYSAEDSEVSKTLGWQIYKWIREGLLRFLPIIILFVLNSQIMIAFRRRQRMFNRLRNRDQANAARDDTLLYILGGIAVMFFVCNIPAAMNLLFINETVKKRLDYQIFRAVANLLEITNHAAQFYIFCVCSSDYRITFMQKFPCLRAYYVNKSKLCSFLRHVPKRSTTFGQRRDSVGREGADVGPVLRRSNSANTMPGQKNREGMPCIRSATITAELVSTCGGRVAEQETVDSRVQLASEESLSDESETLLQLRSDGLCQNNFDRPTVLTNTDTGYMSEHPMNDNRGTIVETGTDSTDEGRTSFL